MNTKVIATVLLVLVALLSVSMVSAIDADSTNDGMQLGSSLTEKTFTQLQKDVDNTEENGTLELTHDYSFIAIKDRNLSNGILISKNINIDGNGYTISANANPYIFLLSSNVNNIVLNNITFKNGGNSAGIAVIHSISNSSTNYNIIMNDCNFINYGNYGIRLDNVNSVFITMNNNAIIKDSSDYGNGCHASFIYLPNVNKVNINIDQNNNFQNINYQSDHIVEVICKGDVLLNINRNNTFKNKGSILVSSNGSVNFNINDNNAFLNNVGGCIIIGSEGSINFNINDNNIFCKNKITYYKNYNKYFCDGLITLTSNNNIIFNIGNNNMINDNVGYAECCADYLNLQSDIENIVTNINIIKLSAKDVEIQINDNNSFKNNGFSFKNKYNYPERNYKYYSHRYINEGGLFGIYCGDENYFLMTIGNDNTFCDNKFEFEEHTIYRGMLANMHNYRYNSDIFVNLKHVDHGNIIISKSTKISNIHTNVIVEYTTDSIETPNNNAVGSALKLASKVNSGLKKVSAKVAQNVNTVTKVLPVVTSVTKVIDSLIAKTVNNNIKTFASSLTVKKPTVQGVKIGWGVSDILKSNH